MIRILLRASRTQAETYVCWCLLCHQTTEAAVRAGKWEVLRQCAHFADIDRMYEPVSFRYCPEITK